HMMFKGTRRLGASDWRAESPIQDELRELYDALPNAGERERREIQWEIERAHAEADDYAIPNEFFRALDEIGATRVNAYTHLEYTDYCALLPANKLEPWAILEADRLSHPVFRGFGNERKVVEEEIRYRKGLSESAAITLVRGALFDDHPYGASLSGAFDSLSNITISTLEDFFETWYNPGNAAVVLVGDFQRAEALSIIEETLGAIPAGPEPPGGVQPVQPRKGVRRLAGNAGRDNAHYLAWRIVDPAPGDYAALRVFTTLLTSKKAKGRKGPRSVHARTNRYTRGGWLLVKAECEERRDSRTCERMVLQRIEMVVNGASPGHIYAAARALEIDLLESLEDHHNHARAIARGFARGQTPGDLWREFYDVRILTPDHFREAIQRHLSGGYIVVKPGRGPGPPHEENKASNANISTNIDDEASSPFYQWVTTLPTPEIADQWLTPGEEYTESTDGRVIAVYNPCNTLFELHLTYPVGWLNDPYLCFALSQWKAAAADSEAGAWGAPLFREGIRLKMSCDEQSAGLSIRGPGEAFDRAVPYLLEQLRAPILLENRAEARKARWREQGARALAAYALHGDLSPYRSLFARDEELKEASGRRLEKAVSSLARFEPDVVYAGPHEEDHVAGFFNGESADLAPPEPVLIPYSAPPRNRILLHHPLKTGV
ncbi:MAG: insulinase family protein, partial [Desulfobacterales bacterium]|nr:insulinase family protein [Desulfobacterales bacterium]